MTTRKQEEGSGFRDEAPVAPDRNTVPGQNALRVKVAELLGFQLYSDTNYAFAVWHDAKGEVIERLPDWPSDLNACAEFEKMLSDSDKNMYVIHLSAEIGLAGQIAGLLGSTIAAFKFTTATAEQRCRAFVATMEGTK